MNTETENNFLVITASGADKLGLIEQIAGRIADCGCNIEESSMAVIGGQFSFIAKSPAHGMRFPNWMGKFLR